MSILQQDCAKERHIDCVQHCTLIRTSNITSLTNILIKTTSRRQTVTDSLVVVTRWVLGGDGEIYQQLRGFIEAKVNSWNEIISITYSITFSKQTVLYTINWHCTLSTFSYLSQPTTVLKFPYALMDKKK